MDLSRLSARFPRDAVSWRVQGKPFARDGKHSAMALAYIDARNVMSRLDEVCGPENWQTEFTETAKGRVICRIGIKVSDAWIWKSDGAGDTDVEGEKGAISDALKRAAVHWGIGRYLYDMDAPWVPCEVGSNGQWRKWSIDPWTRVKDSAPKPSQPENSGTSLPPFDAAAAAKRIAARLSKAAHYGDLKGIWSDERATIDILPDAAFEIVKAAKASRQAEIDPARQSPEITDERSAA